MTVNTGVWRNSGTTSCVSVVIYGKEGKSGVINLNKNFKEEKEGKDNPVFSRASTDHFLVCVDKSLGPLTTLHVAHDNSGNDPSWFLEDVAIKDTSTQDTEIFDCRGWLALEKGDGNIERVLTSRGEKGRMDFKNELSSRTSHSLTEGHIWFSVVAKHPKSNFTRAQRTSCCLLILYSAMLASAMFYKEGTTEQAVHVGPFKFTWKELIVSVESAIVIAPITVLVVTLFRKSRPRARRRRAQPHLLNSNEEPQNKNQPGAIISTPALVHLHWLGSVRPCQFYSGSVCCVLQPHVRKREVKPLAYSCCIIVYPRYIRFTASTVTSSCCNRSLSPSKTSRGWAKARWKGDNFNGVWNRNCTLFHCFHLRVLNEQEKIRSYNNNCFPFWGRPFCLSSSCFFSWLSALEVKTGVHTTWKTP